MSDNIKDVEVGMDATPSTEGTETNVETQTAEAIAEEKNAPAEEKASHVDYNNDIDDDDDDEEEVLTKNGKKKKKPLTREQKKKRRITALISVCSVILALGIFISGIAIANPLIVKALIAQAKNYTAVEYDNQLVPEKEADGTWTFVTDSELKVLQFTDVHIGAGSFSKQKDMWAMNAVATMIRAEKPDLVVVTGDIAYPVPFQAGTFNNLAATQVFAAMMENLGVYWTFAFGNHDTEAYSMKTRADICDWYESQNFKYCLFSRGYADDPALKLKEDDIGYGNNVIRVKNSKGVYTQAIVTFDSHSYIEGDYFGAAWKYDNIHQSQIDWYVGEMQKLVDSNNALLEADPSLGIVKDAPVKNLAFFHIPLVEYREAWAQVIENGSKNLSAGDIIQRDGLTVEYHYGVMGESDSKKNGQRTYGVFCGLHEDNLFEVGFDYGLQGTFCGHDHYNNFSVSLTKDGKTIRLTYGMSIDYLAYPGIYKEHLQRGCTVITVDPDGSFDCVQKNYYTDYNVAHEKG